MDVSKIIKISNKVALYAVVLLAYWVFIFIVVTVFGFKVFRENITEVFYLSILGLFAVLGGAIILNVMLNLTRIAESLEKNVDEKHPKAKSKKNYMMLWVASFPVIFVLLWLGDVGSSIQRKEMLVETAKYLTAEYKDSITYLSNYSFSSEYVDKASGTLKMLSDIDKKFPHISLVVLDSIDAKPVFIEIKPRYYNSFDKDPKKENFIFSAAKSEREYLKGVFNGPTKTVLYSAHDGSYELFYPIMTERGVIVLYLTDRQSYGKVGS